MGGLSDLHMTFACLYILGDREEAAVSAVEELEEEFDWQIEQQLPDEAEEVRLRGTAVENNLIHSGFTLESSTSRCSHVWIR